MKLKLKYILLAFAFMLIAPITAMGAEPAKLQHFIVDETNSTFNVENNVQIKVNNEELESSFQILIEGNEVFDKKVPFGYIRSFYYVEHGGQEYIVLEERLHGSAAALSFSLLELENRNVQLIQQSDEYMKAKLALQNNLQLEVTYPKFEAGDSFVEPSFVYKDIFTFGENGFTKIETTDVTDGETPQLNERSFSARAKVVADVKGENPSAQEINKLLTEKAIANGIPPEVLKAIAWQESRWQQFRISDGSKWKKGDVVIGGDGIGIGIMQVSDYSITDTEQIKRLKEDIEYNIDRGIEILLDKWDDGGASWGGILIPTINDNNKSILEDWYFAILAYNGRLERNDPLKNPINSKYPAYQLLIYKHMKELGHVDATLFPWEKIKNDVYYKGKSMYFKNGNYKMDGPFHTSTHLLKANDIVRVTDTQATLKDSPNGKTVIEPKKGDILVISSDQLYYNNNRTDHYAWYKVRSVLDNKQYYIQAPFVEKINVTNFNRVELKGGGRYTTATAISNYGWSTSDTVVIARGDIPVDGLTGSVLASKFDAPLLLVENNKVPKEVMKELKDLKPSKIYILGSTHAISQNVENDLKNNFGKNSVKRISGSGRYATAANIANEVGTFSEIFIVTDNENSPDSLSIGPVAGQKNAPILFASKNGLTHHSEELLKKHKNAKVYIIGGDKAVPKTVEQQLKAIGISKVERISSAHRYATSIKIADKFPLDKKNLVFVSGDSFIDALPGSPLAAKKLNANIILTPTNEVHPAINTWLNKNINELPTVFFLGGENAISQSTRGELQQIIIKSYID